MIPARLAPNLLHSPRMNTVTPDSGIPCRKRIRLDLAPYRGGGQVFLLTICTDGRHPWFSLHLDLADHAAAEIVTLAAARGTVLHAWCVMPDHLHLLVNDVDVIDFVRILKGRVLVHARRVDAGRRLWQRSFHDHALRTEERETDAVRYVLFNPVRAGIVAAAGEYRWSGSETRPDWRKY